MSERHVTPNQLHGCVDGDSQPVALHQPLELVPPVVEYSSTSAGRSANAQPTVDVLAPVMQLLAHTDDEGGKAAEMFGGMVPDNWLDDNDSLYTPVTIHEA